MEDVAAVEDDLARFAASIAGDRPRDQDLGAEPARLLERAARQLVARDAATGSRGSSRCARTSRPGRRAPRARHDRAQPLRRAVHRRGESGRPGADDDVSYSLAVGSVASPSSSRHAARASAGAAPFPSTAAHRRQLVLAGQRPAPAPSASGGVRRDPLNGSGCGRGTGGVAARGIPAAARARRRAEAAAAAASPAGRRPHAVRGELADLSRHVGRRRGDRVVVVRLDPHARGTAPPRGSRPETRVPSTIGTSPNSSPASRPPTTRSTPSWSSTASILPSSTAKSARSSPSCAAYSPGSRQMSAASSARRSASCSPSSAKIEIWRISLELTATRRV